MHISRLILAIAVIFVLSSLFGNFIDAIALHGDYAALPQVFRAPVNADFTLILASHLAFAIASVWIYSHGISDAPWFLQGLRFGIAMWLITSVTTHVMEFATQPLPESLVWKQLGYELIAKVVLGIVTAAMVRKTS
jgi:hypothetical protein